ncbi:hypothetical protein AB1Y20_009474 [Prymnesium parvum]|uniref:TCTP domain-containing protein n=1 Tax=Prymnesium parvum TaxID=97485 RepID=A0AB34K297_PRYPA|mmetsp:Transcript_30762/g.70539  ORF Transcript_30762/g.70539 Transcript_30762/m.70539 type:complete len:177 (-) Transcript_30762:116-646(-)
MYCRLTGDRLFASSHTVTVVENDLMYCVQGSLNLQAFASDPLSSLTASGSLPLSLVDVVDWAGLRPISLDRSGFIKHWRRYLNLVSQALLQEGEQARSEHLSAQGHLFARVLLERFDEWEFLVSASENPRGPLVVLRYEDRDPLSPLLFFLRDGCVVSVRREADCSTADALAPTAG